MNLCGVARSLTDLAFDALEAVFFLFDSSKQADELWYRDDLVVKEAEEEVGDVPTFCGRKVYLTNDLPLNRDGILFDDSVFRSGGQLKEYGPRPRISTATPNSSSSPLVSAGGDEPAASAHSPSASQAAGNQTLDPAHLYTAAAAVRYLASQPEDTPMGYSRDYLLEVNRALYDAYEATYAMK